MQILVRLVCKEWIQRFIVGLRIIIVKIINFSYLDPIEDNFQFKVSSTDIS